MVREAWPEHTTARDQNSHGYAPTWLPGTERPLDPRKGTYWSKNSNNGRPITGVTIQHSKPENFITPRNELTHSEIAWKEPPVKLDSHQRYSEPDFARSCNSGSQR